ncbi:hypothetical protein Ahy_A09g043146 [Arachis hypogaea]|uniref:Uncharacterized protein n=1 Tax=Arachis hypogaea TaxID=3818 RepID=A0A445BHM5_ARAHY|nr:hypothetical protein Ahy_A09g043146 [Arachis hypogaea]
MKRKPSSRKFDGPLFPSKVNFKELIEEDKEVYRSFHGKTLKQFTDSMMEISVDGDKDRLKFKRTFILYIQMSLLLPTIINKHWTKELLLERIEAKIKGHIGIVKKAQLKEKLTRMKEEEKKEKKKKTQKKKDISSESDSGTDSESNSARDSEAPPKTRKQPTRKKIYCLMIDGIQKEEGHYWYSLLLFSCAYFASGDWFIGTTFVTLSYTHVLASSYLEGCNFLTAAVFTPANSLVSCYVNLNLLDLFKLHPYNAIAFSGPIVVFVFVFLIYPLGQSSWFFAPRFHNWTLNPFHMMGVVGVLGDALLCAIHGVRNKMLSN